MGESLTQQRRVREEGFRIVNLANYVPAAAVIRRGRALSGMTGRKGRVGGFLSVE